MIAKLAFSLLLLLQGGAELSPQAELQRLNQESRAARNRNDHPAYLRYVREVHSLLPGNASVRFALARAYALNKQPEAALAELATLVRQGFGYKVLDDPAFAPMAGVEAFKRVAAGLLANGTSGATNKLGTLELPDEMRGEAVAWSLTTKSFLLGGKGSVYSLGRDGRSSKRVLGKWEAGVLGLRSDPVTGTFLVCLNTQENGTARVARHRLSDGALVTSYPLPTAGALCNDIAILPNGEFAVTDSNNSQVFKLKKGRLAPLTLGRSIFLPNGIAVDPKTNRLFVADANGIVVHDLAKGTSWLLEQGTTSIAAIDGMIWHNGALVGVQNQTSPARLLRIKPDAAARRSTVAVLLSDPALSDAATVAAIGNEAFVYARPRVEGAKDLPRLLRVRL